MWATKQLTAARYASRRGAVIMAGVLWLLLTAPALQAAPAWSKPSPNGASERSASEPLRFSALDELTPQNVRGLRALFRVSAEVEADSSPRGTASSKSKPLSAAPTQPGFPAAADAQLRHFVTWRATLIGTPAVKEPSGAPNATVNYIVRSSANLPVDKSSAFVSGQVTAWDPASGRAVWTTSESAPIGPGAVVTAGGLLFYCSAEGWLKALDARTGELLWKQRVAGARHGEPLSYKGTDGHQYVGVLVRGRAASLQAFSLPR